MSISILLADDDALKRAQVREIVCAILDRPDLVVDEASTIARVAECLRAKSYDLLVLDLNIPMRDGAPPRPDGGLLLMQQFVGLAGLKRPVHIVGLTSFPVLAAEQAQAFKDELWHIVEFDGSSTAWEHAIAKKLVQIVESSDAVVEGYDLDLAMITALHRVELEAVLDLPAAWRTYEVAGDQTVYHLGSFPRVDGSQVRVVAAAAGEMGLSASAAVSMKLIEVFRPRCLAMAGIAAGVKGDFGDILVADAAWDYGAGKRQTGRTGNSVFMPEPTQVAMDVGLKAKLNYFLMRNKEFPAIRQRWSGPAPDGAPEARIGPLASGAAVVESKEVLEHVVAQNRKVIGIEMEVYGVFMAGKYCREPRPRVMAAKSLCDFGVPGKTDEYQGYAAFTSASFIFEFAVAHL